MKEFNIIGFCLPQQHYMVDTSKKLDKIIGLINKGLYFTINRPRQYGKTNTLYQLEQRLQGSCYVLETSFEGASQEEFATAPAFVKFFLKSIGMSMESAGCPKNMISAWLDRSTLKTGEDDEYFLFLRNKVNALCGSSDRPIVLMIDEVDSATGNDTFVNFLGMLRNNYLHSRWGKENAFQSVILAGITDVRNLKAKIRPEEQHKPNSPWNIAVKFTVDMSFSTEEIAGMLQEYEADHQTGMDVLEMASLLREYTSGYPFLVSSICKLMDEEIIGTPEFPTYSSVWTREGFLAAEKRLLDDEDNALFDDLTKQIKEHPDVDKLLRGMLFEGIQRTYNPQNDTYRLGRMYGFFDKQGTEVCVANRIFQTVFYNYYLDQESLNDELSGNVQNLKARFAKTGHLDMNLVLTTFHDDYEAVGLGSDSKFIETNGRKIFLLYLRRIINGTGHYYVEAVIGDNRRTDVIVDYRGEQFVIELKIGHGPKYNAAGEKQLIGYLNHYRLDKGWMLTFSFNKKKETGSHEFMLEGKTIVEFVV